MAGRRGSRLEPVATNMGELVRTLRLQQRLSQHALAARANVPQTTLAGIECGRAAYLYETIRRIARGLKLSMSALDGMLPPPEAGDPRANGKPAERLSDKDRQSIRDRAKAGERKSDLAREYQVDPSYVTLICQGRRGAK